MKILFIGHDANRTGAPISLLNLIEGIKQSKPKWDLSLLLLGGGELLETYSSLLPTFKYKKLTKSRYLWFQNKLFKKKQDVSDLKKYLKNIHPSVIYINTIVPIKLIVPIANELGIPVFCHVREMDLVLKGFYSTSQDFALFSLISRFFSVNTQIKQNLSKTLGVKPDQIHIAPGPFNFQHYPKPKFIKDNNTFKITMSGSSVFIKGLDIAIQSATYFKDYSSIEFHWFGDFNKNSMRKIEFEINKLSLIRTFRIVPNVKKLYDELQSASLFFLCSREDSFPRVAVEAALAELPIFYFKGLTGVEDFLEDGVSGIGLDYLDYEQIKNKILYLKENPDKSRALGKNARISALSYLRSQNTVEKVVALIDEIKK